MSGASPQSGRAEDPPGRRLVGSPPVEIAFRRRLPLAQVDGPGLVWLGGFRSDMNSTKARRLDDWAAAEGRAYLRFDYSGHGESGGSFEEGTIGRWLGESLDLFLKETEGPQILVGSSMGGWIALLLARELAARGESGRLSSLVLIAPAVDFTEALLWARLPSDLRSLIEKEGRWLRSSDYSPDPIPITRELIVEGRRHLLLGGEIRVGCPIRILQGMKDADVPWRHALELMDRLTEDPATLTLIKDGDHRLSREEDLQTLLAAAASL